MAVDTHTTVPNRREQNVGTLSSAPVLSLQSCLQLDGTCGSQQTPYLSILYSRVGHDADRGGEEADARHPPEDQPPSRGLQPRALRGQARAGRQRQEGPTLSN